MGQIMFAGGFSAIPATVVMAPGERIKCLLQIQAQAVERGEPKLYDGMIDCAKKLYRTGGISSVFRGWEATLLRDIPGLVDNDLVAWRFAIVGADRAGACC